MFSLSPTKSRSPPAAQISPPCYPQSPPTFPQTQLNRSLMNTPTTEKHGGPPVNRLSQKSPEICSPSLYSNRLLGTPCGTPNRYMGTPTGNATYNVCTPMRQQPDSSLINSPQVNMSLVGGGSELLSTWVTVYGFPGAAASYILSQFSCLGGIIQHHISPTGNWMHIQYQTKMQARKAISKNGKVYSGTIKIGVEPCQDEDICSVGGKENSIPGVSSQMTSTADKHSTMRPLTQAYKTAQEQHQVVTNNRTPQKNENVLSKAMEYFGW